MNEELMNFVKWLPEHVELFKGLTTEETVSKINNLSTSEEGKETLEQLTKQYKNTEMGIFKEGGKLNYLLCLKKGGAIQDCGCGKKIEKNQPGGEISRQDVLTMLRTTGSSNSESRKEYRDAKRDARESGLRGKEMRQAARQAAYENGLARIQPVLNFNDEIEIEDAPLVLEDNLFADLEVPTSLNVKFQEPAIKIPTFNEAFANARKSGLDVFEWNGKKYNTRLSDSRPYIEKTIDGLGSYGNQSRPYWERSVMWLSKK